MSCSHWAIHCISALDALCSWWRLFPSRVCATCSMHQHGALSFLYFALHLPVATHTSPTQAYISLLSLLSLSSSPKLRRAASTHVDVLLLVEFAVYFYRDICPLATFSLQPVDVRDGGLLWALIGVLSVIAIIIPLVKPRQYTPSDSEVCPRFPHLSCL